jgi:hypothetical protein
VITVSRDARQRLKKLEDQIGRLDPKKRELSYLPVDPILYAKALALLDGTTTNDSDEEDSGEAELERSSGPAQEI